MSDPGRDDERHQAIAAKAYELYLARGEHGFNIDDWLAAEAELAQHPITTAHDEAEMRGAEALAAEEKREAEAAQLEEPIPPLAQGPPLDPSHELAARPRSAELSAPPVPPQLPPR